MWQNIPHKFEQSVTSVTCDYDTVTKVAWHSVSLQFSAHMTSVATLVLYRNGGFLWRTPFTILFRHWHPAGTHSRPEWLILISPMFKDFVHTYFFQDDPFLIIPRNHFHLEWSVALGQIWLMEWDSWCFLHHYHFKRSYSFY